MWYVLEYSLTGCRILDRVFNKKPATILVYGPAGAGKTTLLLHISRRLSCHGEKALFISTEGLQYQPRVSMHPDWFRNILFTEIDCFDKQLDFVLRTIPFTRYKYIFFDTINSLYRLEAYREDSIEKLGLVLAILCSHVIECNGLLIASAQVRAIEDEREFIASGMKILEYWFDVIARLERVDGKRVLTIVKPSSYRDIAIEYSITDKGIMWIGC